MTGEERLEVCKACPLYKDTSFGAICNDNKYINKYNEVSYFPKEGFFRGCGCLIPHKCFNPTSKCPASKW